MFKNSTNFEPITRPFIAPFLLSMNDLLQLHDSLKMQGWALIDGLSFDGYEEDIGGMFEGLFGKPVVHKRHGAGRTGGVRISATGFDGTQRPQTVPQKQSVHTDGAFEANPPVFLTLTCWNPAYRGGVSEIVDMSTVAAYLMEEFPDHFRALSRPDCYSVIRGEARQMRPVFKIDDTPKGPVLSCAFSAHEFNEVDVHADCRESFDCLRNLVLNWAPVRKIKLAAGQSLIMNNQRVLHGRTAWVDSPKGTRSFDRHWFDGNADFVQDLPHGFLLENLGSNTLERKTVV